MPRPQREQDELQQLFGVPETGPQGHRGAGGGAPMAGDSGALTTSGADPKGWDRASIMLKTHPLHRFPRISQTDLILPSGADRLRLLGDSLVFGLCVALLCFFPLWMANVLAVGALGNWVWYTMLLAGTGGALFVYFMSARRDREFQEFLESL